MVELEAPTNAPSTLFPEPLADKVSPDNKFALPPAGFKAANTPPSCRSKVSSPTPPMKVKSTLSVPIAVSVSAPPAPSTVMDSNPPITVRIELSRDGSKPKPSVLSSNTKEPPLPAKNSTLPVPLLASTAIWLSPLSPTIERVAVIGSKLTKKSAANICRGSRFS